MLACSIILHAVKFSAKAMQDTIVFLKITVVFYQPSPHACSVSWLVSGRQQWRLLALIMCSGSKFVNMACITVNSKKYFNKLDVPLI